MALNITTVNFDGNNHPTFHMQDNGVTNRPLVCTSEKGLIDVNVDRAKPWTSKDDDECIIALAVGITSFEVTSRGGEHSSGVIENYKATTGEPLPVLMLARWVKKEKGGYWLGSFVRGSLDQWFNNPNRDENTMQTLRDMDTSRFRCLLRHSPLNLIKADPICMEWMGFSEERLNEKTVKDLQAMMKAKGLSYANMRKAHLIQSLAL